MSCRLLEPVVIVSQVELRLAVMLLVCAVSALAVRAEPGGTDELDRFRAEYPAAEAKLEQAYSHVRIDATETEHDPFGHFRVVETCEFYREGDLVRAVKTCLKSADPNFPAGAVSAMAGSSSKYFEIYKDSPSSTFKFAGFGRAPNFEKANRLLYAPLYCAFAFVDLRVIDFIDRKEVTIISANTTVLDGQQVVEVVAQLATTDGGPVRSHFYFQPRNWALMGYLFPLSWAKKNPGALRGKIDYEPESDPPKVKSIDKWVEVDAHPDMKSQEENWTINDIGFGPIERKEFDISAFGINRAPFQDATTQPDTTPPSGDLRQPFNLYPNGVANPNQAPSGIEVPVSPEENTVNPSPIRLAAYGTGG